MNTKKTNADIQSLRAIAILFVTFHHFGYLIVGHALYDAYRARFGMYTGVDLFFSISGFIISKSYYESMRLMEGREKTIVFLQFWIKRIYRLWPSAWLWLVLLVVGFSWLKIAPFWENLSDAVAAILEVANLHWWMCLGQHGSCGQIGLYWSLSLEEQFYLLFPLLFLISERFHLKILLAIAFSQFFIPRFSWTHDFFWFMRTDAIALGVCVYLLSKKELWEIIRPTFLEKKLAAFLSISAMLIILATVTAPEGAPEKAIVPFFTGVVAVICAVLVWVASYDQDRIFNVPLLRPVLMWIGARSYALYLLQAFAYQAAHKLVSSHWMPSSVSTRTSHIIESLLTFTLMALLAEANFRFVEEPFRRKGAQVAARFGMSTGLKPTA